jgi:CHASE2 domain-containing sensor protein
MTRKHLTWPQRLRHYWVVLPLLLIMLLLAAPELENMGYNPWEQKTCDLQEINQGGFSGQLYAPITRWALRITPTPSVAIIYIDPKTEPAEILTNTCASRVFISRLIQDLNTLHANVIVVDKFYSKANCSEEPKNKIFLDTMNKTLVPVVVGQPTQALDDTSKGGCLALSPKFEFNDKANVHYGLTRLNSDTLKLPLRWPIFQPAAKPNDPPIQLPEKSGIGDSISLVAATQQDPNLQNDASVQKLLSTHVHPYTTFVNLPHTNAMSVLCSAEPVPHDAYGQPFGDACKGMVHPINNLDGNNLQLNGKIVVIGDKVTDSDMQPFPDGEKPGVWLQANYIQSLLDRRFLREVPLPITLICLLIFIFVVYCLFWYIEQPERALLAGLALVIVLIVVTLGILVSTSYFTPLWALWGAGLLVIFRYLETQAHHLSAHLKQQHTDPTE